MKIVTLYLIKFSICIFSISNSTIMIRITPIIFLKPRQLGAEKDEAETLPSDNVKSLLLRSPLFSLPTEIRHIPHPQETNKMLANPAIRNPVLVCTVLRAMFRKCRWEIPDDSTRS